MSKIYAIDDLNDQNWIITEENVYAPSFDLMIGFSKGEPIISFVDLKFGFVFSKGSDVLVEKEYPPEGVRYQRTDQTYLVSERIKVEQQTDYSLYLWAENENKRIEKTFDISVPRPKKPYESWVWNDRRMMYDPPVPYPNDGNDYTWNEETTSWVVAETDETQS